MGMICFIFDIDKNNNVFKYVKHWRFGDTFKNYYKMESNRFKVYVREDQLTNDESEQSEWVFNIETCENSDFQILEDQPKEKPELKRVTMVESEELVLNVPGGFLKKTNKYRREIKPGVTVDVYDVLKAFNVTCPAMAHAIKKMLVPGKRGHKDASQDKKEAIASIKRSMELDNEN